MKSCQNDQEKFVAASKIEKVIPIQKVRVKGMTAQKNLENTTNKKMLLRNKNSKVDNQEFMDPSSSDIIDLREEKIFLTINEQIDVIKELPKEIKNEEEKQEMLMTTVEDMILENNVPLISLTLDLKDLNEKIKDEKDISSTDNIVSLKITDPDENTESSLDVLPESVSVFEFSTSESNSVLASNKLKNIEIDLIVTEETKKIESDKERRTEEEMVKTNYSHQRKSTSFDIFVCWYTDYHRHLSMSHFQYFSVS